MRDLRPEKPKAEIALLMHYAGQEKEVPDPYYDDDRFDLVYRMIADGVEGLLAESRRRWGL